jgi:energy-coupling factor transport system permease protein
MSSEYLPIPVMRIPGNSLLHRLHPNTKLLWVLLISIFSFMTTNPVILGSLISFGLVLLWISGTGKRLGPMLALLIPITSSLIFLQAVSPVNSGELTEIAYFGPFTIYQEGLYSGFSKFTTIWAVSIFGLLLIATTHPSDLFTSLQKLGLPYELNFMINSSLQLVPIVQQEFFTVLNAQRSRGLKISGFRAVLPSFVPVFVCTVERIQQQAMSLEARAFGCSGPKTNLRAIHSSKADLIISASGLAIWVSFSILVVLNREKLYWGNLFLVPAPAALTIVILTILAFIGTLIPLIIRSRAT